MLRTAVIIGFSLMCLCVLVSSKSTPAPWEHVGTSASVPAEELSFEYSPSYVMQQMATLHSEMVAVQTANAELRERVSALEGIHGN